MKKLPTVTIGIPAFNEEANIANLLNDLVSQTQGNFKLRKIFVASDGSDDQTVSLAKSIKSSKIQIFDFKDRKGRAARQTFMMKQAKTDIFVLLDADMVIYDPKFIEKLLQPMIAHDFDLVSGNLRPLPPENFFEKILFVSMEYKRSVFESYKKGNNLFTCYGPMRAFSKRIYSKIEFDKSVAEDMYSYLYCKANGYHYGWSKKAIAYFKLPTNFGDYRKQSTRYWSSAELFEEFGEEFVKSHYFLPKYLFFTKGILTFFKHPIYAPLYPFITLLTRAESIIGNSSKQNTWSIASSSKLVKRPALPVVKPSYNLAKGEASL